MQNIEIVKFKQKVFGKIDLDKLCRCLEWVAIGSFVLGVIASVIMGLLDDENWPYSIAIIICSFLDSLFLLFLSRIGDAIDDIRNQYLGLNNKIEEDNNEEEEKDIRFYKFMNQQHDDSK